jgi:hypothetical protein
MQEKHIKMIITEIFSEPTKILHSKKEPRRSEDNGKLLSKLQWLLLKPKVRVLLDLIQSIFRMVTKINLAPPETLGPITQASNTQITSW